MNIFLDHIKKTIVSTYSSLEQEIQKSKDPVIFSTYVIGSPGFNWSMKFWLLPGKHIHTFLLEDIFRLTLDQNREDYKIRLQKIMKERYDIDAKIEFGYFYGRNEIVMQYDIKK